MAAAEHEGSAGALAAARAGLQIRGDGTLVEDPAASPAERARALRFRIAADMVGPAAAEALLAHGEAGKAGVRNASGLSNESSAADDIAPSLLLELHANALARGGGILKLILTPVMDGIFAPVLKVAVNMLAPAIMENVNEGLQNKIAAQVPADVARAVANTAGTTLAKGLSQALAGALAESLAPALTRSIGVRLRDSVPDAVAPRVAEATLRATTATVIDRLTPRLAARTGRLVARALAAILTRSVTHALVSTLTPILHPQRAPPEGPARAALEHAQCEACAAARSGAGAAASATVRSSSMLAYAELPDGRGGAAPPWAAAASSGDTGAAADALACFLCEEGSGSQRRAGDFAAQQLAHHYAEYFSRHEAAYFDAAHAMDEALRQQAEAAAS